MRAVLLCACLSAGMIGVFAQPSNAAGCLKGAVVGGLAGHLVHHGVLGAAAGCAIGHHEASKQAQTAQQSRREPLGEDSERSSSARQR